MAGREAMLVDFGSTMTKVRIVDLSDGGRLVAAAEAPTTVRTTVADGLREAIREAGRRAGTAGFRRACSSAAGGLRMVAVGLVPGLTAQAAQRAALGAGARVIATYGFLLGSDDLDAIRASAPDILLLAGGIDGGNREVVIANARSLAASGVECVVVMAGNRAAVDDVREAFARSPADCVVTENVMPEVGIINLEPCRDTIRTVFEARIVHARGMDEAAALIGVVAMPTPLAVLRGAELLSAGTPTQRGLGDLVMIDIGGATTDVHSICDGAPTQAGVVVHGLPEPRSKRSVEGDLGMRVSAPNVLSELRRDPQLSGADWQRVSQAVVRYSGTADGDVLTEPDHEADIMLASAAADIAMGRHAGTLERVRTLQGWLDIQRGKDLTDVGIIIGTGGVFRDPDGARQILHRTVAPDPERVSLRPREPRLLIDRSYCLAAAGLLRDHDAEAAFGLAHRSLVEV